MISLYIFYIHRLYRPLIVFSFLWDGDSLKITIPVFLILIPKYVTVRNIFTKQNIFKLQTKRKWNWVSCRTLLFSPGLTSNLLCPCTDSPQDLSRKVEDDTVIFTDIQTGSSAVYQCNISNEYGYLLSNTFVNVLCKSINTSICIRVLLLMHIEWLCDDCCASLQPSRPECWHQPTKSTKSSKTTGPWWIALPLAHPSLKLHGELMNL